MKPPLTLDALARKDLPEAIAASSAPNVAGYLDDLRQRVMQASHQQKIAPDQESSLQHKVDCALQLANDARSLPTDSPWAKAPLIYYAVPAISPIKRLPDQLPPDGKLAAPLSIIAAKDTFEPASFVAFSFKDIDALELKPSALNGDQEEIPAENLDIKVVKCWYQAGTAWHSYFADPTRRELVPELLLKDENLILVDRDTEDNYLRVDYPSGSEYIWVSYTKRNDPGPFNYVTEPVADSHELQPARLTAGECKQFWITLKVPKTAAAGRYQGDIALLADGHVVGKVPLHLRVLPFALPEPKTYYDMDKHFYVSIYNHCDMFEHMRLNGNDIDAASKRLLAEYENMRDHGCLYPLIPRWDRKDVYGGRNRDAFVRQLEVLKQSGLNTKPLLGAINTLDYEMIFKKPYDPADGVRVSGLDRTIVTTSPDDAKKDAATRYKERVDQEFAAIEAVLGHNDVYPVAWDEPSRKTLVGQREAWQYVHEKGGSIMATSTKWQLFCAAHNMDFSNFGGYVSAETARKWHAVGAKVTCYASPHTGPENPGFIRRTHGMMLYKTDLDGTCNYMHYEGPPNIWNEFNKNRYRSFCMVYPTKEGVIDTLAWEGFREAVDDIRYATKLRELAFEAVASADVDERYAGKMALQWLANLDEKTADLNTARMEMINHIMILHTTLNREVPT